MSVCLSVTLRNFKGFEATTFAYRATTRLVWRPNQGDAKDTRTLYTCQEPHDLQDSIPCPFLSSTPLVSARVAFQFHHFGTTPAHSTLLLPLPCHKLLASRCALAKIYFYRLRFEIQSNSFRWTNKIKFIREAKLFDISVTIHQAKLWLYMRSVPAKRYREQKE